MYNQKGNIIRRNRRHLIPTNEEFDECTSSNAYDTETESIEELSDVPNKITEDLDATPEYVTRYGREIHTPDRYGYN